MGRDQQKPDPMQPLKGAPKHIDSIIKHVVKLEHQRLHMQRPHLIEDVISIIKAEVNDDED